VGAAALCLFAAAGRVHGAPATPAPSPGRGDAGNPSLLSALSFSGRREPITVTADALEFDYRSRLLTYKGRVEVTQGDIKLNANTLTITLQDQTDNQVKEVVAEGQVRVTQGTRWATGGRAVFDQTRHTVVLSQNAVVHDGPNEVSGDRIVVYLDEQRSVVEGGGGRVKAVLFPSKDSNVTDTGERR
jgi:lipopolysaccharide export system protein LptA